MLLLFLPGLPVTWTARKWQLNEGDTVEAVEVMEQTPPADDRAAERAALRAHMEQDRARHAGEFRGHIEAATATAMGERPGGNLDEYLRLARDAARALNDASQRLADFEFRCAQEDAGAARPVPALRETVARDRIRIQDYENTVRAIWRDDEPFGREEFCTVFHGPFGERLMRAFGLGNDLPSVEAMADEIAARLPPVGAVAYLARERELRVVEADESHPIRWAIVSPKIPAPPFPAVPDLAPLYARAMELRAAFLADQGIRDAPTREEEHLARHWAWQRLRAEAASAEEHRGKSLTQVGRELYRAGLIGWVHAEDAA